MYDYLEARFHVRLQSYHRRKCYPESDYMALHWHDCQAASSVNQKLRRYIAKHEPGDTHRLDACYLDAWNRALGAREEDDSGG